MINFDKIIENIFVGTCPASPVDITRLQQAGITAVLNLQTDMDFGRLGIDWLQLETAYETADIAPYRVPIVDFDRDDLVELLPAAAQTLNNMLDNDHRVYVHCTAGIERSPAVVIAYMAWHKRWGMERSIELVKAARNCSPYEDALQQADILRQGPA